MKRKRVPSRPTDLASLRARVADIRLRKGGGTVTERARKLLLVYLDTAQDQDMAFEDLVRSLRSGLPALQIAGTDLQRIAALPDGPLAAAACREGCAFCCILAGKDGGTISESEARRIHAAVSPKAGEPDGRQWHPDACAALDPLTRTCRAYTARPLICRTYVSSDVAACERIARGTPAAGAGVLGAQGLMLAMLALTRAALDGVVRVPTYSLSRVTAGAVDGEDLATTLRLSRQPPRTLDDERHRFGG